MRFCFFWGSESTWAGWFLIEMSVYINNLFFRIFPEFMVVLINDRRFFVKLFPIFFKNQFQIFFKNHFQIFLETFSKFFIEVLNLSSFYLPLDAKKLGASRTLLYASLVFGSANILQTLVPWKQTQTICSDFALETAFTKLVDAS